MKITLQEGNFGTFCLVADDGQQILVQTEWDFAGLASTFGWSACSCGVTDGTVDCEHRTAGEMIADAHNFLRAHTGDETDDPGYF